MISSGADKATKQKALADMQAKRALNAARQAQLAADCSDDDDFAQTAGDRLADALGALSIKKPQKAPAVHDLCDSSEDGDYEAADEEDGDIECVEDTDSEEAPSSEDGAEAGEDDAGKPGLAPASITTPDDWVLTVKQDRFQLAHKVHHMLYTHQVAAVEWLWGLWVQRKGCLLADDMGLGKTLTCASLLAGLLKGKSIRRAIVVAPKTLLAQWKLELTRVGLKWQTHEYFGTPRQRETALTSVQQRRGVLLTTYGMITNQHQELCRRPRRVAHDADEDGDVPFWDVFIVDEGHKIKNPATQIYKALAGIPVHMRVLISGTPIQNNLMELHALYDYCCPGLLGDKTHFKRAFANKIADSQEGAALAAEVRDTIAPYFLRRTKADVMGPKSGSGGAEGEGPADASSAPTMPGKSDFIIWLRMDPFQRRLYEAFLLSDRVKAALNEEGSALTAISVLKKICDHPALLTKETAALAASAGTRGARKARLQLKGANAGSDDGSDSEYSDGDGDAGHASTRRILGTDGKHLVQDWGDPDAAANLLADLDKKCITASCKTVFIMQLLALLQRQGHRTLIFSQSLVMLGIIEAGLRDVGTRYVRIDGSVTSADARLEVVNRFQADPNIPVFLLSAKVGGLGLTITAADRVIIADPAWNPATDNQSVDRAYRIGQTRPVIVYRLITCGTVEEKIYRRQVFKSTLAKVGLEESNPVAHFSSQQLVDLFAVVPEELQSSVTAQQLQQDQADAAEYDEATKSHLSALMRAPFVANTSDHMLLFHADRAVNRADLPQVSATFASDGASSSTSTGKPGDPRHNVWAGGKEMSAHGDRVNAVAQQPMSPRSKLEQQATALALEVSKLTTTLRSTGSMLKDGGARLKAALEEKVRHLQAARDAAAAHEEAQGSGAPPPPASHQPGPSGGAAPAAASTGSSGSTAAWPSGVRAKMEGVARQYGWGGGADRADGPLHSGAAAPVPAGSADSAADDLAAIMGGMQLGRPPAAAHTAQPASDPRPPTAAVQGAPAQGSASAAVHAQDRQEGRSPHTSAAAPPASAPAADEAASQAARMPRGSTARSDDSFLSAESDDLEAGTGPVQAQADPRNTTGLGGPSGERSAQAEASRSSGGQAASTATDGREALQPHAPAGAAKEPVGVGQENRAALVAERVQLKAELQSKEARRQESAELRLGYRKLYERYEEVKKALAQAQA